MSTTPTTVAPGAEDNSLQQKRRVSIRTRALKCHKNMVENLSSKTDKEVVQTYVTESEVEAYTIDALLREYYKYKGVNSANSSYTSKFFNDNHFYHLVPAHNALFYTLAQEIVANLTKIKPSELTPIEGELAEELDVDEQGSVYSVEAIYQAIAAQSAKISAAAIQEPRNSFTHDAYSCMGVRNSMEDRMNAIVHAETLFGLNFKPHQHLSFFGVFDGHSGSGAAEYARTYLHSTLFKYLKETNSEVNEESLTKALKSAFTATENLYLQFAEDYVLNAGTTAMITLLLENGGEKSYIIGYAGDSQAVISSNGVAKALLNPHRADRKDEKERIEKAGGKVYYFFGQARVNGVLAVSRSIGDPKLRDIVISDPEITPLQKLEAGQDEFLVLATDGLWDVMTPQDVVNKVHAYKTTHGSIKGVSAELVKDATAKKSKDNISITVLEF